MDYHINSSP